MPRRNASKLYVLVAIYTLLQIFTISESLLSFIDLERRAFPRGKYSSLRVIFRRIPRAEGL